MNGPKILLLYSTTGGGHRSVAEAIAEGLHRRMPGARPLLLDLLHDSTRFPINRAAGNYQFMVQRAPFLWKTVWWMGEDPVRLRWFMRLCLPLVRPAGRRLRDEQPDLVISVHPLLNHLPLRFLREAGSVAPFVTVVTDWATVPAAWFCPDVDLCIVPGDTALQRALAAGLAPRQLRALGLPVSNRFRPVAPSEKPRYRQALGVEPNEPLVLLVGGGDGTGPMAEIASALACALGAAGRGQLAVVCGTNHRLRRDLARRSWPLPVAVEGFVGNMHEWMAGADVIVTKAGPSTIAEALTVGLPIVLYAYIPGQEEGNVPFVVEQGVGAYAREPHEIGSLVTKWLAPDDRTLDEMRGRARLVSRPGAADAVVDEVVRFLPD